MSEEEGKVVEEVKKEEEENVEEGVKEEGGIAKLYDGCEGVGKYT